MSLIVRTKRGDVDVVKETPSYRSANRDDCEKRVSKDKKKVSRITNYDVKMTKQYPKGKQIIRSAFNYRASSSPSDRKKRKRNTVTDSRN